MSALQDAWVKVGMVTLRAGYVIGLLFGIAMLFSIGPKAAELPVHVGAGALTVFGGITLYLRLKALGDAAGRAAGVVLLALVIGAANGLLALVGVSSWLLHLVIVGLAVFAAETVALRLKRAS